VDLYVDTNVSEEHTVSIITAEGTLWSALKFQWCSLRRNMGDDVSRETKGITNSTMVSKAKMGSKVIVETVRSNNNLGPQL
jgi:hypothetical protein